VFAESSNVKMASEASGARFDRPSADPNHRKQDRSGAHAFHRVEQSGSTLEPNILKQYFFDA